MTTIGKIKNYRQIVKNERIPMTTEKILPLKPIGRVFFGLAVNWTLSKVYQKTIQQDKKNPNKQQQEQQDQQTLTQGFGQKYDAQECIKTLLMIRSNWILDYCWNSSIKTISNRCKPFLRMVKITAEYIKNIIPCEPLHAQKFIKERFFPGLSSIDQVLQLDSKSFKTEFTIRDDFYLLCHEKIQHTYWYTILYKLKDIGIIPEAFDQNVNRNEASSNLEELVDKMIHIQHSKNAVYDIARHDGLVYAANLKEEMKIFEKCLIDNQIWTKIQKWHNDNMSNRSVSQKTIFDYFKEESSAGARGLCHGAENSKQQRQSKNDDNEEKMNIDSGLDKLNQKKRTKPELTQQTDEQNQQKLDDVETGRNIHSITTIKNRKHAERSEKMLKSLQEKNPQQVVGMETEEMSISSLSSTHPQQTTTTTKVEGELFAKGLSSTLPPEIIVISSSSSGSESESDPVVQPDVEFEILSKNQAKHQQQQQPQQQEQRQQQQQNQQPEQHQQHPQQQQQDKPDEQMIDINEQEENFDKSAQEAMLILAAITKPTSPLDAIEAKIKPFTFTNHVFYADIVKLNEYMLEHPSRYQSLNKASKLLLTFPSLPRDAANLKSLVMKVYNTFEQLLNQKFSDSVGGKQNLAFRIVAECYPDRYYDLERFPTISSRCHIHLLLRTTKNRKISLRIQNKEFYQSFHQTIKYKAIDIELCKKTRQKIYFEKEFTFRPHLSLNWKRWNNVPDPHITVHYPPDEQNREQNEKLRVAMKEFEEAGLDSTLHKQMGGFIASQKKLKARFYYFEHRSDNYHLIEENKTVIPENLIHERRILQTAFDDSVNMELDQKQNQQQQQEQRQQQVHTSSSSSSSTTTTNSASLLALNLKTKRLPVTPDSITSISQFWNQKKKQLNLNQYRIWRGKLLVHISGQIFNLKTKKQIYGSRQTKGYVQLSFEGKKYLAHRVVAEAWFPEEARTFRVVHHLNGQKSDNRVSNLTWTTNSQNNIDRRYRKPSPDRPTLVSSSNLKTNLPKPTTTVTATISATTAVSPGATKPRAAATATTTTTSTTTTKQTKVDSVPEAITTATTTTKKNTTNTTINKNLAKRSEDKNDDDGKEQNKSTNVNDGEKKNDINDHDNKNDHQINRSDHDVFAQFHVSAVESRSLSQSYLQRKQKEDRRKLQKRSSDRLQGLKGEQRLKELEKIKQEMLEKTPYEMDRWKRIALDYGDLKDWDKPSVIQSFKHEIFERFSWVITQQAKLQQFIEYMKDEAARYKLLHRRSHDIIQQSDDVVKTFQLKTLVRKNEPNWVVKVAHWVHNIVQHSDINISAGHKAKNLWIWGEPNFGKSESIVNRIESQWPCWIIEKSTAHWSLPQSFDVFGILEEAKDLYKTDIPTFKSLLEQSNATKQLRGLYKQQKVKKVPPVIITSNYSMEHWFKHINASIEDIEAMKARFMEVHANVPAVYGLFWQEHQIDLDKKGWKFNVRNECANKVIQNLEAQDDPYFDLEEAIATEEQKVWQNLIATGQIPAPIPQELILAGSKNVEPKLKHYEQWLILYKDAKNQQQSFIYTPQKYEHDHMNRPASSSSSSTNLSSSSNLATRGSSSTIVASQFSNIELQSQTSENNEEKADEMEIVETDDGKKETKNIDKIDVSKIDIDMDDWPDTQELENDYNDDIIMKHQHQDQHDDQQSEKQAKQDLQQQTKQEQKQQQQQQQSNTQHKQKTAPQVVNTKTAMLPPTQSIDQEMKDATTSTIIPPGSIAGATTIIPPQTTTATGSSTTRSNSIKTITSTNLTKTSVTNQGGIEFDNIMDHHHGNAENAVNRTTSFINDDGNQDWIKFCEDNPGL